MNKYRKAINAMVERKSMTDAQEMEGYSLE